MTHLRVEANVVKKAWWKDTLERLGWTFLQGSFGSVGAIEIAEAMTGTDVALGMLFSMLVGGIGAVFSFIKSVAAAKVSEGGTAQLGAKTYSYTEPGPGAAGANL